MSQVKIGQIYESFSSGPFVITEVNGCMDISIKFINTGTTICGISSSEVFRRKLKDHNKPTVHGVGYIGYRRTKGVIDKKAYNLWINMIARCYSGHPQYHTYKDVTVHPDWHNFSVFKEDIKQLDGYSEWYDGEDFELDKDLLNPKSDLYSKNTCCFISGALNVSLSSNKRWSKCVSVI